MLKNNKNETTCSFKLKNKDGFTLVELLIVLVISGFLVAAIAATFQSQNKSYVLQDQISEMQQNLRAGMLYMMREIRTAGYDENWVDIGPPVDGLHDTRMFDGIDNDGDGTIDNAGDDVRFGIWTANANLIRVVMDINPTDQDIGDADEDITYSLYDAYGDGDTDLGRNAGGGNQPVAENIEGLGFAYAYDTDLDGDPATLILDTSPNGHVIWAADTDGDGDWDILDTNDDGVIDINDAPGPGANIIGFDTNKTVDTAEIRAVRVWMLGRTNRGESGYVNNLTYVVGMYVITPKNDADPLNDNFHMKLVEANIKCRNLGL